MLPNKKNIALVLFYTDLKRQADFKKMLDFFYHATAYRNQDKQLELC